MKPHCRIEMVLIRFKTRLCPLFSYTVDMWPHPQREQLCVVFTCIVAVSMIIALVVVCGGGGGVERGMGRGGAQVQSQFSCAGLDKLLVEWLHSQSLK